ncbi:hypothetical protein [Mycobacterium kyorinense]|uniref:hypothetical protein n=1 Tax=Mycobacterium kyorinense TaxID=487514 RepID=UPI000B0B1279|nr:hypothetical protein [Mycobacterium kyorinense]
MRDKLQMIVVVIVAAIVSGCGAINFQATNVPNPMTPEQSKAQVVNAAQDIVHTLHLDVTHAYFSRSSCNDQGEAPFRGVIDIYYPRPADLDEADAKQAKLAQDLRSDGWSGDADFHTHGTALKKNNVEAVLWPANEDVPQGHIELNGECRDVTTTKDTRGDSEDIKFN